MYFFSLQLGTGKFFANEHEQNKRCPRVYKLNGVVRISYNNNVLMNQSYLLFLKKVSSQLLKFRNSSCVKILHFFICNNVSMKNNRILSHDSLYLLYIRAFESKKEKKAVVPRYRYATNHA